MQKIRASGNLTSFGYKTTQGIFTDFLSGALSVLGGIFIVILLWRSVEVAVSEWSPTLTARECFRFPENPAVPDRENMTQLLLSAAFFGSDALYFDGGEENTGMTETQPLPPSDIPNEEQPQNPLGEPDSDNPDITNIYSYDYSALPDGELALIPYDLTYGSTSGEVSISNTTVYTPDIEAALTNEYPIKTDLDAYSAEEPLILIVHTHGTESYSPNGALSVTQGFLHRSSDTQANVVAVGKVMADMLNEAGIPTLHCETMHDLESYTRSYNLAADTIQKYLAEYPSIQYVFDVHRDAIVRQNGDLIRPITVINGEITAQVMLLVGTNEQGADHPDWETNFTVAAQLQDRLVTNYERFARPINIRGASFNEQFTKGSLLIEIGSAANSLEEAKNAAKYLTYSIIDMIKDNAE
ncbi:MAG: stage II sporulation protein P [Clostridia bacterium]|nr:stage II sporulation protein P [Clostridia bacterium]